MAWEWDGEFVKIPPTKTHLNHTSAVQSELLIHHHLLSLKIHSIIIKCTSNPTPTPTPPEVDDFPDAPQPETNFSVPQPKNSYLETEEDQPEEIAIEKRSKEKLSKSVMLFKKPKAGLVKPEPKNFEIGWKRTKVINLEKPKGYVIVDFLGKLETLMDKGVFFGSKELLAKTGEIVAEKAREETEVLREEGKVDERLITKLMEIDLAMVKASVKEETLKKRVEQAKVRCRQAILVSVSKP